MQDDKGNVKNVLFDLLQKTNKGIFLYDLQAKKLINVNSAFEEIMHVTSANVRDDPSQLMELVHSEDRDYLLKNIDKLITGKVKDISFEFRIIDPSEIQYWICVSAQRVNDGDNFFIGGFVEDITKPKHNLLNAKKFAAKKDSVLEILAHDLAGPLSNISAASEMLIEHGKAYNDPEFDKLVNIISRTSE